MNSSWGCFTKPKRCPKAVEPFLGPLGNLLGKTPRSTGAGRPSNLLGGGDPSFWPPERRALVAGFWALRLVKIAQQNEDFNCSWSWVFIPSFPKLEFLFASKWEANIYYINLKFWFNKGKIWHPTFLLMRWLKSPLGNFWVPQNRTSFKNSEKLKWSFSLEKVRLLSK